MRSRPLTLAFDAKAEPSKDDLGRTGWRPSVTAQDPRQDSQSRQKIIDDFFKAADSNNSGRLKRNEMWRVAVAFGFPPDDPEEEFQEEYEDICQDFKCKQQVGLDLAAFTKLLNDKDSEEWYASDDKLKRLLTEKFKP